MQNFQVDQIDIMQGFNGFWLILSKSDDFEPQSSGIIGFSVNVAPQQLWSGGNLW